jgi:hypothetical protein
MNRKGWIEANYDAIEALFEAVVNCLCGDETKLAVWFVKDNLDLSSIKHERIGGKSPFQESKSILAGSGFLIKLDSSNAEKVIQHFFAENYLLSCGISHFQIESNGSVQFEVYDNFGVILFGNKVSIEMLEDLKSRQVICDYQLE